MENRTRNGGMKLTEADFTKMPSKEFLAIIEKLQAEYPGDFKAFIRGMLDAGNICSCQGMFMGDDEVGYVTRSARGVKNTAQ